MKKILLLSLFMALCVPWTSVAQTDDLYYVPQKKEKKQTETRITTAVRTENPSGTTGSTETVVVHGNTPVTVSSTSSGTTVVVKDRRGGNERDVDEYNRRYSSDEDYYADAEEYADGDEATDDGLDGEWVNGFEGTPQDYEYATRIIRFHNPRYAISIGSPLYIDVVYGLDSWNWNVYTDGLYAYAFPTFSNPLWWDWRFNSFGWWGYPYPYYGWGWHLGWYSGWYAGWHGWGWGWHHPHPGCITEAGMRLATPTATP